MRRYLYICKLLRIIVRHSGRRMPTNKQQTVAPKNVLLCLQERTLEHVRACGMETHTRADVARIA